MPLYHSLSGISSPYARINAIEPVSATFAATLQEELVNPNLSKYPLPPEGRAVQKPASLMGYGEALNSESAERKPALRAQDIMMKSVLHLKNDALLSQARDLMQREHIQHLPILNERDTLAGILSDRDVLRAGADLNHPVSAQMTSQVLTATPDTGIPEIAEAMLVHKIHALPIVDAENRVLGILTTADILRAIVTRAPLALWA